MTNLKKNNITLNSGKNTTQVHEKTNLVVTSVTIWATMQSYVEATYVKIINKITHKI